MVHAAREVHEVHEVHEASHDAITTPSRQPGKGHRGFAVGILVAAQLAPFIAMGLSLSLLLGGQGGTGWMWSYVAVVIPVAIGAFGMALFLAEGDRP